MSPPHRSPPGKERCTFPIEASPPGIYKDRVKTYTLECELATPVSVQTAFDVFEDPYNLAKIIPPWLHFQILTRDLKMRLGAEIDYTFRWKGFPMYWKTRISQYEPPFLFMDEALRSPYVFWRHEHRFRHTERGTIVSDRVQYAMPYGLAGQLVHRLAVAKQLLAIFSFRQKAIAKLLGAEGHPIKEPLIIEAI